MSKYRLTDRMVRGVLESLRDLRRKSLQEIVVAYNRMHPPARVFQVIGMKVMSSDILTILEFLQVEGLVERDLLSYTDQVLDASLHHYTLTRTGIQYINTLH